jgi:hypothetical protein
VESKIVDLIGVESRIGRMIIKRGWCSKKGEARKETDRLVF